MWAAGDSSVAMWAAGDRAEPDTSLSFPPGSQSLIGKLELWRTKLTKGGRIIFEIALDFSERERHFMDMIRIWTITENHEKYEADIRKIEVKRDPCCFSQGEAGFSSRGEIKCFWCRDSFLAD